MSKKVAVIDGNSLMHRAYHAVQTPMTAPDGTPTNAVFGFMQMFCKFAELAKPDAVICAFDEGKPEFRIADLPQYKAHRPHMDDELRVQFPVIEQLLEAMNVPVVKVKGWEGDDILGTIAARDEELGFETLLVTGDKDACQLATDLTRIVTTKRGISDVEIMGPAEVAAKYGVTPDQFTDFLGLMGDSSDNIPGVPGVGPKTATTLLEKYGSIEGVYQNIDEVKGKLHDKLAENEEMAVLSRQIATIVRDLDFPLDIEGAAFPEFDQQKIEDAFKKYSLMSPLARVLKLISAEATQYVIDIECKPILDGESAKRLVEEAIAANEMVGIAVEQSEQASFFGDDTIIAFSAKGGSAVLGGEEGLQVLTDVVSNGRFSALDVKAILRYLNPADTSAPALLCEGEIFATDAFDLALAGYVLNSTVSSYSYEALAEKWLGGAISEDIKGIDLLCVHAAMCRIAAPKLREAMEKEDSWRVYSEIDLPLVPVLSVMERTGAAVDTKTLASLGEKAGSELKLLSEKIYELAGEEFNIDSPKQLSHVLFEVMGLPPLKKTSRGYSTNATVLKELAKTEEIAEFVIRYRELAKLMSTYIDNLPKMIGPDKRIHTNFHETVTATGRISSSDPNLQNIPVRTELGRKIRDCFVPLKEGEVFLSADYSQIELRLLAHLSGDEHLIEAFKSGEDFHANTAARVFGVEPEKVTPQLRSRAKAVNFGIVYGQQAYGLSQSLDIPMNEAREMIDRYFTAYPGVKEYLNATVEGAAEKGYAETMYGRKRHIPELRSANKQQRGVGERTAMNHPMQGTAADIIKLAMIEVMKRLLTGGFRTKLLLQVHDELDFSVPKNELESIKTMVRDVMENVVKLDVPLDVDVSWGANWGEAH